MAWGDRIQEAAYTSPSGQRLTFTYEDVKRVTTKKTSAFNFPDAQGTYVQDLGVTGRRYPMRFIFWGDNYDLEANAFEAALSETGVGKLEHPIYGTVNVIPFGDFSRRDDLKTAANQAIIDTTLWDTIGLVYPLAQTDLALATANAVAAFNAAQAQDFGDALGSPAGLRLSLIKDGYNNFLDVTEEGLQAIADTQQNVQRQFDNAIASINRGIDVLIADPLTLAFQTSIMIQAPARALTAITDRLNAYANLAQSIFTPTSADSPSPEVLNPDDLQLTNLYAMSYVSGSVVSSINGEYETKSQAIQTAENILAQLDNVIEWRDAAYNDSEVVDTGGAYQALQSAVATSAGFLIEASFSLKQERSLTLDKPTNMIPLVSELYNGDIDGNLDFFIQSNNLNGDEILELPRGKTVVYYV